MSLIEGIGDEVTVLVTSLLVLAVIIVAWTSTRVDVRTHTSIVIIDRERFGELLRRVRGIAVGAHAANQTDADIASHSSASAAETHAVTDSLLVSGASAAAHVGDINSQNSHSSDVDECQGADGEQKCLHEAETAESPGNTPISSSVESSSQSTESASACQDAAAPDSQSLSPQGYATSSDVPSGSIQVRLQFVDGRQRTVFANPDDTLGNFKRNHFASELASNLVVRFIAGGQELKDETSTLRSHRITFSGAVLHCLVTPARATTPTADDRPHVGYQFDIGILMFPLFGTLLAALWYARVVYRGYFNGTSTFSLLAISFLYIVALLASLRGTSPADQHHHIE